MKKALFSLVLATILMVACGHKEKQQLTPEEAQALSLQKNAPGDSAHYGLACDGCTDSILVFLPYSGGDLDTFDIITAHQQHRIYGRPHIGDELAVITTPGDPDEAYMVINMEQIRGTWCYMVSPTLRVPENMPKRMQRRMMERIPDSIKQRMMVPREYTLKLKRDYTAQAWGARRQQTSDDMSPVEYPAIKYYTAWQLFNGRLVLTADTIAGFSKEGDVPTTDTVDIVMLHRDTLVLRFPDHQQGYYKKVEIKK